MVQVTERFYDNEASFNHSVESNISYLLSKAVEERGNAIFLVSGGVHLPIRSILHQE